VGELGVSVSPTADGHEVATAIVLAHSKPDLAARARQVMMREYPPRNNVDRWTEYLQTVCRGPFIPRIMVLVPRERAASLDLWAARLLAEQDFLDLACVAVEDDTGRELPPTLWDEPWCPVFRVSGPLDVATLLRYIRADAIFTFMSAALDSLLRSNLGVPIVVVPPDPEDSGLNSQGLVGLIDT